MPSALVDSSLLFSRFTLLRKILELLYGISEHLLSSAIFLQKIGNETDLNPRIFSAPA